MFSKKEFGDYQTPLNFTDNICSLLIKKYNFNPNLIIEPTCGVGNFIKSSSKFKADKYIGIDINKDYCNECKNISWDNLEVLNENIFTLNLRNNVKNNDFLLLIGNPPWVTNSNLSVYESTNIPTKINYHNLRGIDALTGSSNFDISETIIIKLLEEFKDTDTVLSFLCKTGTVRRIFLYLKEHNYNFELFDTYKFDSKKIFDVDTSACLFVLKLSKQPYSLDRYNVFNIDHPDELLEQHIYKNGNLTKLKPNRKIVDLEGNCCFTWRQGIKHDCASIMELTLDQNHYFNKVGQELDIESDLVYPLVKTSLIKEPIIESYKHYVIVPQTYLGQDTSYIKEEYPKLSSYLELNRDRFKKRKSRIYQNKPPYSIFGIGKYTFSKFKVAISGFNKMPLFSLLKPTDKPVMLDDTCYYISFDSFDLAYTSMLCLNSNLVQGYIKSISFIDSKRPYTKKVLQRIDFNKIVEQLKLEDLVEVEYKFNLIPYITEEIWNHYKDYIKSLIK